MSSIVAVAGGSGGLGRAIIDALKGSKYEAVILARNANPNLEAELGVRILAADYTSVEALTALFEKEKIDTVISVANSGMDTTPELNLIKAADRSTVTRRFIPNIFSGIDHKEKHAIFPLAAQKLEFQKAMQDTSLEWTAILIGLFLDYYAPGYPTYVKITPFWVDVKNNAAAIPGPGDRPVHFTHTWDVGKFIVPLLGLENWERKYFISGDTKTWNEVVAVAEQVKGVKFDVTYDSAEKLATGQVTELPIYKEVYPLLGGEEAKPMLLGMLALIGAWYTQGWYDFGEGTFLNTLFPEVKAVGLKEAMERGLSAK